MAQATYGKESYPKQLNEFQQQVNPKPSKLEMERLKQERLDIRKNLKGGHLHETN